MSLLLSNQKKEKKTVFPHWIYNLESRVGKEETVLKECTKKCWKTFRLQTQLWMHPYKACVWKKQKEFILCLNPKAFVFFPKQQKKLFHSLDKKEKLFHSLNKIIFFCKDVQFSREQCWKNEEEMLKECMKQCGKRRTDAERMHEAVRERWRRRDSAERMKRQCNAERMKKKQCWKNAGSSMGKKKRQCWRNEENLSERRDKAEERMNDSVRKNVFWRKSERMKKKLFDEENVEKKKTTSRNRVFWPKSVVHRGQTFLIFSKKLFQKVRVWTKKKFLFKPSLSEQSFLEKIKTSVLYIDQYKVSGMLFWKFRHV